MVRNCIVFGCSNTPKKGVTLFNKFPTDARLKRAWTLQVQRTKAQWKGPSKHSAVCSDHFSEDCFEPMSVTSKKLGIKMKQMLKPTGIPSIFKCPSSSPKRLQRPSSALEKRERGRV